MSSISTEQLNQARLTIDQSQDLLILLGKNPTLDQVASGLSLYLGLSARGKRVTISCPDPMTVAFNQLVGIDKITNNVGSGSNGKNLVISFPYQEGSIEKVSYNIENDTFNLVIEPREGYPQITQDLIQYAYSGGDTDLIITIGISNLNDLENFYPNSQNMYANKQIINIDSNSENQLFGKFNLVDPSVTSISELLTSLISQIGLTLDSDISSNLYAGIVNGSNNFTSTKTNAMTFEAAAVCLKKGANKPQNQSSLTQQPLNNTQMFSQQTPQRQYNNPSGQSMSTNSNYPPKSKPVTPQMGFRNQPVRNKPLQPQPQQIQQQQSQQSTSLPKQQPQNGAPPDWLKPKIYKGSSLL